MAGAAADRVRIDPDAVDGAAGEVVRVADALRSASAAAEVDLARPDVPAGFLVSAAAAQLWTSHSAGLDTSATDAATFGQNLRAVSTSWRDVDAAVAGQMGR